MGKLLILIGFIICSLFILSGTFVFAQEKEPVIENIPQETLKDIQDEIRLLRNESYQQVISSYRLASDRIERLILLITLFVVFLGVIISIITAVILLRGNRIIRAEKAYREKMERVKQESEKMMEKDKKRAIESIKIFKKAKTAGEKLRKELEKKPIKRLGVKEIKKLQKEIEDIKNELYKSKLDESFIMPIGDQRSALLTDDDVGFYHTPSDTVRSSFGVPDYDCAACGKPLSQHMFMNGNYFCPDIRGGTFMSGGHLKQDLRADIPERTRLHKISEAAKKRADEVAEMVFKQRKTKIKKSKKQTHESR